MRAGLRTLRLDRVAHAELSQREFVRPAGFDAAQYLTRALATLPRAIATEVLLYTDLASARRELIEALGVPEACAEGVVLRGSADELDWYARELMRLPFRFEVRAPPALRAMLVKLVRELLAHLGHHRYNRLPLAASNCAPRLRSSHMLLYRSQIEIKSILEKLRDARSMLWAYLDNGERLFVTRLMHVDPDCGFLVICYGPEKQVNAALMAAASVALHASVGEAFVEFVAQGPSDALFEEVASVRLAFPDALLSGQRRAHPRVKVPPSVPLRCIADSSGVASFEAQITDISQGGIGTIIYAAGISLSPGVLLRGCKIVHPWGDAMVADLEVTYSVTILQADGGIARRSGFRFAQRPARIEALMRIFVIDLEGKGGDGAAPAVWTE